MLNNIKWNFFLRSDDFIFKVVSRCVNVFISYNKTFHFTIFFRELFNNMLNNTIQFMVKKIFFFRITEGKASTSAKISSSSISGPNIENVSLGRSKRGGKIKG